MTAPSGQADKRTARHTLRTVLQVLIALAGGIPAAAAGFDLPAATTGKVMAVLGLFVVLVTALQNAGEQTGALPTLLPNPLAEPQPDSAIGADPAAPAVGRPLTDGLPPIPRAGAGDPPVADLDLGRPPYRGRDR